VPDDHVSVPFPLPSLAHLTEEELGRLRTKVATAAREARRKANLVLQRSPSLKKPWSRSLSVHKGTSTEDRAAIMLDFERELLRVPEAFIAHAYANALVTFEGLCREEGIRRVIPGSKKKRPPEQIPGVVDEAAIVAAMLEQVGEDEV
jgi:hypothetical protein